jgi:hypothetical protein
MSITDVKHLLKWIHGQTYDGELFQVRSHMDITSKYMLANPDGHEYIPEAI